MKAQMTIYTLAMLYHVTNGNISLYKIWQNQGLSDNLKKFIDELAKQLFQRLTADKPETSTFRDFCKSPKTWDATKKYILSLDFSMITDDFKSKNEDAVRKDAGREITDKERKEVEKYGVAFLQIYQLGDKEKYKNPSLNINLRSFDRQEAFYRHEQKNDRPDRPL